MSLDDAFLAILICPATGQRLKHLDDAELADLNRRIAVGGVHAADGTTVAFSAEEALVTEDGTRIYPIQNGVPVLLVEEAILTEPSGS